MRAPERRTPRTPPTAPPTMGAMLLLRLCEAFAGGLLFEEVTGEEGEVVMVRIGVVDVDVDVVPEEDDAMVVTSGGSFGVTMFSSQFRATDVSRDRKLPLAANALAAATLNVLFVCDRKQRYLSKMIASEGLY